MQYPSLSTFIAGEKNALRKGPLALVFAEDDVEIASTIRHLIGSGFKHITLFGSGAALELAMPDDKVVSVRFDVHQIGAVQDAINAVIAAAPKQWIHYCYNAEYFYYPFRESRDITELTTFHAEERRDSILTYLVDAYASDLKLHSNGVSTTDAYFDSGGYFGLRRFVGRESTPLDRQLNFFGGLRWRFEEHIPFRSRQLSRVSLFRAKPGLKIRSDFLLNDEEMNTISCPWHHNITAAMISFRAAKALRHNPGSRVEIDDFMWQGSTKLDWTSQQLLDLGFIEPGQWF